MAKIRDRTIVRWLFNGEEFDEEFIFYDNDKIVEDDDAGLVSLKPTSGLSNHTESLDQSNINHQVTMIIMNNCIEKIAILKCIAQKNYLPCDLKFPEYKTCDERFGDKIIYGEEFYSEGKKRYVELTMIFSVLYYTLEELLQFGTIKSLHDGTLIVKQLRYEEEKLFSFEKESIVLESDLKTMVRTQAKDLEEKYAEKLEELRSLEVIYEDAIGYGNLQYKYIEHWEASRRHQGKLILENEEGFYNDIINSSKHKSDMENRIHNDICRYLDETTDDMEREIKEWMYKYEYEIEMRDSELLKLRMDREAQMEKYLALKVEYEKHQEFIDYWFGIKEQRRIEFELRVLQNFMAIRIQAWWRGVMVRRHLGRFRRGKRRGKGAKRNKSKKPKAKQKK